MPRTSRIIRTVIAALLIILTISYLRPRSIFPDHARNQTLTDRRQAVEQAFEHAWRGYSTYCMGHDNLHPVSNTCDDDFGGWGATAFDALSTAIIMRKRDIAVEILRYIGTISFQESVGKIQLFEVTIRHLGGLLSAWDLLNGPFKGVVVIEEHIKRPLYDQAVRLGEALACAFDTPSGIPRNWVDTAACKSDDGTSVRISFIIPTKTLRYCKIPVSEIDGFLHILI